MLFLDDSPICAGHLWYISCDFWYFIIGTILVYGLVMGYRKISYSVIGVWIFAEMFVVAMVVYFGALYFGYPRLVRFANVM